MKLSALCEQWSKSREMTRSSRRKIFWRRGFCTRSGVPRPYARRRPFTRGCRSWTGCQGTMAKMHSEIWWPESPWVSPSFLSRWRTRTSPVYRRRYINERDVYRCMIYKELHNDCTGITLVRCTFDQMCSFPFN